MLKVTVIFVKEHLKQTAIDQFEKSYVCASISVLLKIRKVLIHQTRKPKH